MNRNWLNWNILRLLFTGFILLLIHSCNQNRKQIFNSTDNSEKKLGLKPTSEKLLQDSFYSLLNGKYNFSESTKSSIPSSSSEYFSSTKYPYYFPKTLIIDYFCPSKSFKLSDYYIFNRKNNSFSCEYIALIDTNNYSQVIAKQCVEMENWIVLYIISKDFKIIDKESLLNTGGNVDDVALVYDNKKIEYEDFIDSLKYENGTYWVSRSELYSIEQETGNVSTEIGFQQVKVLQVNSNGEIIRSKKVTIEKEYIDKYKKLNNYRFK